MDTKPTGPTRARPLTVGENTTASPPRETPALNVRDFAPSYEFRGLHSDGTVASTCVEVYDGDTIRCHLTLPVWHIADEWIRLRNVNCPELWEPGGQEARDFVASLVLGEPVWVRTFKRPSDDEESRSFVRLIADVGFDPDSTGSLRNLAQTVVAAGHGLVAPA